MFFAPVAEMVYETGEISTFNLVGFYQTEAGATVQKNNQYFIMLFGLLIFVLNLIIIFMYRNRLLQLRLCMYNMILLAGLTSVVLFVLYGIKNASSVSFSLPAVFPIIAIILHYLAFRGIRRDELRVQSVNHLR